MRLVFSRAGLGLGEMDWIEHPEFLLALTLLSRTKSQNGEEGDEGEKGTKSKKGRRGSPFQCGFAPLLWPQLSARWIILASTYLSSSRSFDYDEEVMLKLIIK